jgi:hypothetical protein
VFTRGLNAGTHVERTGIKATGCRQGRRGGGKVGRGDIARIHEVTRLFTVAVHRERAPIEDAIAEDRHHPCLAVWVLSRPVHIAVAQCDGIEAVHARIVGEIILHRQLRDPVWRFRIFRQCLRAWRRIEIPVQRTAGGRKDHARRILAGVYRAHEIERTENIARRVVHGIEHTAPDIDLRREMAHDVELSIPHERCGVRRGDIPAHEARFGRQVLNASTRQVVENGDVPALSQESVRHMRTNETRPARHQNRLRHAVASSRQSCRCRQPAAVDDMGGMPSVQRRSHR